MILLRLTAVASTADAGIHEKVLRSLTTTQIISNKQMKDIKKIVKSLEYSGILMKGVTQKIEN